MNWEYQSLGNLSRQKNRDPRTLRKERKYIPTHAKVDLENRTRPTEEHNKHTHTYTKSKKKNEKGSRVSVCTKKTKKKNTSESAHRTPLSDENISNAIVSTRLYRNAIISNAIELTTITSSAMTSTEMIPNARLYQDHDYIRRDYKIGPTPADRIVTSSSAGTTAGLADPLFSVGCSSTFTATDAATALPSDAPGTTPTAAPGGQAAPLLIAAVAPGVTLNTRTGQRAHPKTRRKKGRFRDKG